MTETTGTFDAKDMTEALQEGVRRRDRHYLDAVVSDRMIWVMPLADNERSKQEWIEASCSVTWNWFEVDTRRVLEIGDDGRLVESWIRQSREPVDGEEATSPVTATGVVVDVWARENGTWRLVARHPQRADSVTS
ncbi:nuclear transport factor 2 family protein [Intrasporangium oryzae]|nr:nuclear transport factor 2 family protein [Intrasporangium oryzae]